MDKATQNNKAFDAHHVQGKIELIEKGLPIDISEPELMALEDTLRGARSFYLDILMPLEAQREAGTASAEVEATFIEESKNLASVDLALRKIDDFRKTHWKQIKNAE